MYLCSLYFPHLALLYIFILPLVMFLCHFLVMSGTENPKPFFMLIYVVDTGVGKIKKNPCTSIITEFILINMISKTSSYHFSSNQRR